MIKKLMLLNILFLMNASLLGREVKFPYLTPRRFSVNPGVVSGEYILGNITFTQLRCGSKIVFTDAFLPSETKFLLRDTAKNCPNGISMRWEDIVTVNKPIKVDNRFLFLDTQNKNAGFITRKANNGSDQIIFYLLKRDGPGGSEVGSKLVFDVDKFEKYLTQTYEYYDLSPDEKVIGNFTLNFVFHHYEFVFTDIFQKKPIIEVKFERKNNQTKKKGTFKISDWIKETYTDKSTGSVKDKAIGVTKYNPVTDEDLKGIIQILPMTEADIKEVSGIVKNRY